MIYLDNAATTIKKPQCVKQAVFDAMERLGNSARGMHGPALAAAREIYAAREKAAAFSGQGGLKGPYLPERHRGIEYCHRGSNKAGDACDHYRSRA